MDDSPTLRGQSLTLRPTVEADLADYERWQDPTLAAWQTDGPWFKDDGAPSVLERRRRWLGQNPRPAASHLEIEVGGRHVGWVVVYHNKADAHITEVGIDIVEDDCWNRGIGTKALALWVDYLFRERGLTRIGLSTWSGNPRMIRVAEKLGFRREACIRNGCEVEGRFYDRLKYGLLRSEWQTARAGWPMLD